ncbi:hypothetical protein HDV00_000955 [Rhizophlyctis rosea]|nr:hypothetical protein HDV00_000955 [Rhizophlyctis rosea]
MLYSRSKADNPSPAYERHPKYELCVHQGNEEDNGEIRLCGNPQAILHEDAVWVALLPHLKTSNTPPFVEMYGEGVHATPAMDAARFLALTTFVGIVEVKVSYISLAAWDGVTRLQIEGEGTVGGMVGIGAARTTSWRTSRTRALKLGFVNFATKNILLQSLGDCIKTLWLVNVRVSEWISAQDLSAAVPQLEELVLAGCTIDRCNNLGNKWFAEFALAWSQRPSAKIGNVRLPDPNLSKQTNALRPIFSSPVLKYVEIAYVHRFDYPDIANAIPTGAARVGLPLPILNIRIPNPDAYNVGTVMKAKKVETDEQIRERMRRYFSGKVREITFDNSTFPEFAGPVLNLDSVRDLPHHAPQATANTSHREEEESDKEMEEVLDDSGDEESDEEMEEAYDSSEVEESD